MSAPNRDAGQIPAARLASGRKTKWTVAAHLSHGGVFNPDALATLTAGGMAGVVSRSAVAPLERVKLLKQGMGREGSIGGLMRDILRSEGVAGLWRGNFANCVRIFPSSALQFYCFSQFKPYFVKDEAKPSPVALMQAGGLAGAVALLVTYPLDHVRALIACKPDKYQRVAQSLGILLREGGFVGGWYRGIVPSLLGIVPYVGVDFAVYEVLKAKSREPGTWLPEIQSAVVQKLLFGGLAGVCGQTAAFPIDTLRRRIQMGESTPKQTMRSAAHDLFRAHGVLGFYKGIGANYAKAVPSVAIGFVVFDTVVEHTRAMAQAVKE